MKPEARRAQSQGPSEGAGQDWLFPAGGHSRPHSQTPGVGDVCGAPLASSRNWAENVDETLCSLKQGKIFNFQFT